IVGDPAGEIVDFARREEVDVIVISTHGHTGWKRLLVGSVTEKVIRYARCCVLSVPRPEHETPRD
ncbi:MAG: universal stress protein, partial [Thermodesulfobacteriota bacterium]